MDRVFSTVAIITIIFGISLLIIPGIGIAVGLTKKHIFDPAYQRYLVPPTFVDDTRCCR